MVSYAIRAVGPHLVRAFPAAHLGFPESVLGCRGRPRIMGLNPRLQRGLGDPTIETDIVGAEWAAEVQYVHMAEKLFDRFMTDSGVFGDSLPTLVTGLDEAAMESRLENRSELALLQSLAEGAQVWPGFKPSAAIDDHREFLNEVLAASNLDPFLLKLRGEVRDKAAMLLGRMVTAMVPDDHINDLRAGIEQLEDYPAIATFLGDLRHQVLTLGTIDESKLMKGPQAVSVEL